MKNNQGYIAGGDIYLTYYSSASISGTQFYNSNAAKGALLFGETLQNEKIRIENSYIGDVDPVKKNQFSANPTLIDIKLGSLVVRNTLFYNITSSVFNARQTSVDIHNVSLDSISCLTEGYFCIIQGPQSHFSFSDSSVTNVISRGDLIPLYEFRGTVNISNVLFSQIRDPQKDKKHFVILTSIAGNVEITNSIFLHLQDFSGASFTATNFTIRNITFSNLIDTVDERYLVEESSNTQFLSLSSSYGLVLNSTFINNSPNPASDGGVISFISTILTHIGNPDPGSGGDYQISNSLFQQNQGRNGGAISVGGGIANIEITSSVFINNTASLLGGAIYYASDSNSYLSQRSCLT